ncbi:MAG TPA: hypothetical protein VNZ54_02935, partial [bacterium]|nr:hypothetical protein [bacterium]
MKLIIFIAALAAAPCHLAALSPTRSQHAWVAGTGETGAEDGPFMVASFDRPGGILFDRGQDRLIVADTGNQALRAVDLGHRNSVTTLRITQSGTGAAFPWLEPVALAWKVDGRLLYCFDRKKPGVALVDLASGSAQWLPLPLSVTSRSGTSFQLAEATALHAVPGDFGVLALRGPGLLFFDLPGGRTAVSGLWGLPGGIADLGSDTDGLWAISREANLLFRLAPDSAQPGWMDAFPKIVTGTANCPDMVADTAVGRAVANPWAIVKGVSPLKVACNAPAIMAYRNASG